MQVSTIYKPHGSYDDLYRVETCTDPCSPNWSDKAASTAADDDLYRIETCTDPCAPNRSDERGSTEADDDLYKIQYIILIFIYSQ